MKKRLLHLLFIVVLCFLFVGCGKGETPITVKSIEIETQATKLVFDLEEEFSSEGLAVKAVYSDASSKLLTSEEYTIDSSAYDKTKGGSYTIIITLNENNEMKCTYEAIVKEATSISIKAENNVLFIQGLYFWYSDDFGITVTIHYSDGSTDDINDPDILASSFALVDDEFMGFIDSNYGKHTCEIYYKENEQLRASFEYSVVSEEDLTVEAFRIITLPTILQVSSIDELSLDGIELGIKYKETGDTEYNCGSYYVVTPEEVKTGKVEVKVYYAYDETVYATFEVEVVDLAGYTLSEIRYNNPHRTIFYVNEEDASIYDYDAKIEKVYKKEGSPDIVLTTSNYEMTEYGSIDTSVKGKQTITISIEDSEVVLNIEVEVKDFVLEDGVYLASYAGLARIMFKVVDHLIYYFDSKTNQYNTTGNEIVRLSEISYALENNRLSVIVYDDEEDSVNIDFVLDGDELTLEDCTLVNEKDLITLDAYNPAFNFIVLWKVDNKIPQECLDAIQSYGTLYLDKDGKTEVTADTIITGNTLYLLFNQEDYTGKPFLGTYYMSGEEAFTITATGFTIGGATTVGYTAEEVADGWNISVSGTTFFYDSKDDVLVMDAIFTKMIYTKTK